MINFLLQTSICTDSIFLLYFLHCDATAAETSLEIPFFSLFENSTKGKSTAENRRWLAGWPLKGKKWRGGPWTLDGLQFSLCKRICRRTEKRSFCAEIVVFRIQGTGYIFQRDFWSFLAKSKKQCFINLESSILKDPFSKKLSQ